MISLSRFSKTAFGGGLLALALSLLAWHGADLLPQHPKHFDQDAYIWQMKWKSPLRTAVHDGADIVHAWRVLFAHIDTKGRTSQPDVDAAVLRASARPVVIVIRIEDQIENFDANALQSKVLGVVAQARSMGLLLSGVEIDHDCASAQLARYTQFLAALHQVLGTNIQLFITALPAWLTSPLLPALLQQADEAVLQVHAVQNPRQGLFNAAQALAWTQKFGAVTPHPFRVALPTYGSRLRFDEFGNLASVESEAPLLDGGNGGVEWVVSPAEVQTYLRAVSAHAPAGLQGIAWFRLPTGGDSRAWHTSTWRALATGEPLHPGLQVLARPADSPGLFDILLHNAGDTDALWPDTVEIPHYCTLFDGINAYRAADIATRDQALHNTQMRLLQPQHEMAIAWARCQHNPEHDLHAHP